MIISDLNHLETVEKKEVVGGLDYFSLNVNTKITTVTQKAAALAINESVYGGGGAYANASNYASIGGFIYY